MQTEQELRIAICDDSRADIDIISEHCESLLKDNGISYSIDRYASGAKLLSSIHNGAQYNLLILDVVMDRLDGMSLANQIRGIGNKTQIIFISSNIEMALSGYEVNATRFLSKPLRPEKLEEELLYCYRTIRAKKGILIPTDNG